MPSVEGFYSGGAILPSHLSTVTDASNTGPATPTPVHLPGPRDLGVTVGPTRPLPAGEGWGCPSPAPPAGLRVGHGGLGGSSQPPGPEHRAPGLTCLPGSGGGEGSQRRTEDDPRLPFGTCRSLGQTRLRTPRATLPQREQRLGCWCQLDIQPWLDPPPWPMQPGCCQEASLPGPALSALGAWHHCPGGAWWLSLRAGTIVVNGAHSCPQPSLPALLLAFKAKFTVPKNKHSRRSYNRQTWASRTETELRTRVRDEKPESQGGTEPPWALSPKQQSQRQGPAPLHPLPPAGCPLRPQALAVAGFLLPHPSLTGPPAPGHLPFYL